MKTATYTCRHCGLELDRSGLEYFCVSEDCPGVGVLYACDRCERLSPEEGMHDSLDVCADCATKPDRVTTDKGAHTLKLAQLGARVMEIVPDLRAYPGSPGYSEAAALALALVMGLRAYARALGLLPAPERKEGGA